jgi:uncharacterized protein YcbK (DUF882 family)
MASFEVPTSRGSKMGESRKKVEAVEAISALRLPLLSANHHHKTKNAARKGLHLKGKRSLK